MNTTGHEQVGDLCDKGISLAGRIARWTTGENRLDTSIPGLSLHRWETPTEPTSYMLSASICLIGQGRKCLFLGEESYVYDAHRFLVTSVDLPVVTQVIEASSDSPYLGLTLELDLRAIAQLILGQEVPSGRPATERLGVAVSEVSVALLDAFNRLIDRRGGKAGLERPAELGWRSVSQWALARTRRRTAAISFAIRPSSTRSRLLNFQEANLSLEIWAWRIWL